MNKNKIWILLAVFYIGNALAEIKNERAYIFGYGSLMNSKTLSLDEQVVINDLADLRYPRHPQALLARKLQELESLNEYLKRERFAREYWISIIASSVFSFAVCSGSAVPLEKPQTGCSANRLCRFLAW